MAKLGTRAAPRVGWRLDGLGRGGVGGRLVGVPWRSAGGRAARGSAVRGCAGVGSASVGCAGGCPARRRSSSAAGWCAWRSVGCAAAICCAVVRGCVGAVGWECVAAAVRCCLLLSRGALRSAAVGSLGLSAGSARSRAVDVRGRALRASCGLWRRRVGEKDGQKRKPRGGARGSLCGVLLAWGQCLNTTYRAQINSSSGINAMVSSRAINRLSVITHKRIRTAVKIIILFTASDTCAVSICGGCGSRLPASW